MAVLQSDWRTATIVTDATSRLPSDPFPSFEGGVRQLLSHCDRERRLAFPYLVTGQD